MAVMVGDGRDGGGGGDDDADVDGGGSGDDGIIVLLIMLADYSQSTQPHRLLLLLSPPPPTPIPPPDCDGAHPGGLAHAALSQPLPSFHQPQFDLGRDRLQRLRHGHLGLGGRLLRRLLRLRPAAAGNVCPASVTSIPTAVSARRCGSLLIARASRPRHSSECSPQAPCSPRKPRGARGLAAQPRTPSVGRPLTPFPAASAALQAHVRLKSHSGGALDHDPHRLVLAFRRLRAADGAAQHA